MRMIYQSNKHCLKILLKVVVHFRVDCILIFAKLVFFCLLSNTVPPEGVSQRMEQPNVPNDIVPKPSKFHYNIISHCLNCFIIIISFIFILIIKILVNFIQIES